MQNFKRRYLVLPPSNGKDLNWHVIDEMDLSVAHCYGFNHSVEEGEGLAKRIAACLNYFSEVETEEIQKLNLKK